MKKFVTVSLVLHAVVLLKLGNNLIEQSTYAVSQGLGTIYMEVVPEASIAQAKQDFSEDSFLEQKVEKLEKSEFAKIKKTKVIKKKIRKPRARITKQKKLQKKKKIVVKEAVVNPELIDLKSYQAALSSHARLARARLGTSSSTATVKASPDYLKNPPPAYPRKSRLNKEQGTVLLLVDISEKGEALKLTLKNSSGHRRLDRSALESVRNWKFKPARISGLAIQSTVLVPVRYVLN